MTTVVPWRRGARGRAADRPRPESPVPPVPAEAGRATLPELFGMSADEFEAVPDPGDPHLFGLDPAAAVVGEEPLTDQQPVPPVITDRRRARRARRRNGRPADVAAATPEEELLPVDPAAAVAPEPEPEPAPDPEPKPEPEPEPEDSEAEFLLAPDEPRYVEGIEIAADADLTMHVVEVPPDAPAEFVRDFLSDVQHLIHAGVPTAEQVEAAEDRATEDWLPEPWLADPKSRAARGRRRGESRGLPVVRPPSVPARRRARRPRRFGRAARYVAVVLLIGGAASVPWVVPAVPDWFASALPQGGNSVVVTPDPTILPAPTPTVRVPTVAPAPTFTGRELASAGRPLEVWVPRLKVRAPVVPISGQSGVLDPPSDPRTLGWWQEGRGAGAKNGSSVVTGHTVSTGGGAFDNLGQLTPGDRLRVRTDAGWITYVVEGSRDYSRAEIAEKAAEVFELDGEGRLVLITCSDFNGQVYLSNAVVFATPVGDEPFVSSVEPGEEVPDGGLRQPWDEPGGNTGETPGVQLTEKPF